MANTSIEWTEVSWNPVTGCDRISPGCDNCYALTLAKRLKAMGVKKYQNDGNPHTSGPGFAVTTHEDVLNQPYRWRKSKLVFVNSMSDLFHAHVPPDFIKAVFRTMEETPQHTYQVLTKRPKRVTRMIAELPWPENVWLGVSVETDQQLWRLNELRKIPATVRFVSAEPLLGPLPNIDLSGIHWVIAGGESGPNCRPVQTDWVRELRDECQSQNVPFFFKQWGGLKPKTNGRTLDGHIWNEMPKMHQ